MGIVKHIILYIVWVKIEHYVLPVVILIFLVQVTVNVFKPLTDRNSVRSSIVAQRKERIYYSSEIAPEDNGILNFICL